jgi:hypothetical protein
VEGDVGATAEGGAAALESEGSPGLSDDGGVVEKKREAGNGTNDRR